MVVLVQRLFSRLQKPVRFFLPSTCKSQIPNCKLPYLRWAGAGSGEISPIYIGGEPGQPEIREYARLGLRGC